MSTGGDGPAGARILDGRALASEMLAEAAAVVDDFVEGAGARPSIRIVRVGDDAASEVYARRILATARRIGAHGEAIEVGAHSDVDDVRRILAELSTDPEVSGVILQMPLPSGMSSSAVIEALDPAKDLDGLHPFNAGLVSRGEAGFAPSCAEAALVVLKRSGIPLAGRRTVVVGRSNVVGRPAQLLLIREDATVTVCHRQTRDLRTHLKDAEIIVVAAGSPGLVTGGDVPAGATVIDCGINVLENHTITGDVDLPSVLPVAGAVTPVPGGVGPVTNAVLMQHLVRAAGRVSGRAVNAGLGMAT